MPKHLVFRNIHQLELTILICLQNTSAKNTQTVLVNVASKQTQTQATKQTKSRLVQTDKQKVLQREVV